MITATASEPHCFFGLGLCMCHLTSAFTRPEHRPSSLLKRSKVARKMLEDTQLLSGGPSSCPQVRHLKLSVLTTVAALQEHPGAPALDVMVAMVLLIFHPHLVRGSRCRVQSEVLSCQQGWLRNGDTDVSPPETWEWLPCHQTNCLPEKDTSCEKPHYCPASISLIALKDNCQAHV